eukprot:3886697-Rhodomonas_salina.2
MLISSPPRCEPLAAFSGCARREQEERKLRRRDVRAGKRGPAQLKEEGKDLKGGAQIEGSRENAGRGTRKQGREHVLAVMRTAAAFPQSFAAGPILSGISLQPLDSDEGNGRTRVVGNSMADHTGHGRALEAQAPAPSCKSAARSIGALPASTPSVHTLLDMEANRHVTT